MITDNAGTAGRERGTSAGRSTSAATSSARARPQAIRNGASNDSVSAATPPSAGPAIEPTPVAPRATPSAWPRFSGAAVSETSASAEIQLAADPTPCTARAAISTASESDAAIRPEPAAISSQPGDQHDPAAEHVGGPAQGQ